MENKKEKSFPNVSVGADTELIQKIAENSISEYEKNIKSFEEMQREMQLSLDPSYLKAVSMNELFDTQYQSKPPLMDRILLPRHIYFCRFSQTGKEFSDGAACLSRRHRNTVLELYHPKRNGTVSCPSIIISIPPPSRRHK